MANQKIHEYPLERFVFGDEDYYDIDYWDGVEYQTAKILGSVIKAAMLSGVAISLTAPSAFIVGGSPTDGTGTLTLTAAGLANQYIRGDGTLATFPTSSGGGNSVNYYLNGGTAASVPTYYQMSKIPVIGTGVDFSLAGNGLISQWLTDLNDPNVTEIPAGNWNFEMFFSASSAGGVPKFYIEILKYDGITFTTISDNSAAPESITSGTTIDLYLTSVAVPLTPLLVTDRLAIRVYIVDSTLGRTIIQHTQNSHLCQIITSFSSGLSSINGLTKQTQYLAVGTAGTDFNIDSVTDTHTFNLPTASATKRGALSSADWVKFNACGAFGISDSSGIYTYYSTLTLAMAAATSGQTIEMFANVTETGAVTITLKNGVNINGNGYTYTLNVAGVTNAFSVPNGITYSASILNLNVIRTGSTSDLFENICFLVGANVICDIDFTGSRFTNLGSGVGILIGSNSTGQISNATARSKSTYGAYFIGTSYDIFSLTQCIGYGYSGGTGIRLHQGGIANNCFGYSDSGTGFYSVGINNNCVGVSVSGSGFNSGGGRSSNCTGRSISGTGFLVSGGASENLNCVGISVSGTGISTVWSISNCSAISSSGNAILFTANNTEQAYNTFAKTSTNSVLFGSTGKLYNCILISDWNNAAGYGVKGNGGNIPDTIVNCVIRLANTSAPYLFNNGTAKAISMRGNTYQGGAAFNANLTQAITNVEDNQGNIYL